MRLRTKRIKVTSRQYKAIILAYRVGGFTLVLGLLTFFSIILGNLVEFVSVFSCYFITKGLYAKQYHSKSLAECIIISFIVFAVAILITVNIKFSIMFSLVLGLLIAFASYKAAIIQFKLKDYNYIEPRYNELKNYYDMERISTVDIYTLDDKQLYAHCRSCGLSEEDSRIAYFVICERLKGNELYSAIGYSESQSKRKRKYILQKLKN